jgi:integrase
MAMKPTLFLRRDRVWTIVYIDHDGKKRQKAIPGCGPNNGRAAKEVLAKFIRRLEASRLIDGEGDEGPLTVARWAGIWLASRRAKGIATVDDYRSRLEHHVLPIIGAKRLDAVRTADVEAVMSAVAAKERAPRTQRHVFYTMNAMFQRAVNRDPPLIERNPCAAIPEEDRPAKVDADPEWRPKAKFSRQEVEILLTSALIPWDRRVFYAVAFLTGSRFGETAALRIRHYDPGARPLGQLTVAHSYNSKKRRTKRTKTSVTRLVPVHRWLAEGFIAPWLATGWVELMGRAPTTDDILIPTRRNTHRNSSTMWRQLNGERDKAGKTVLKGDLERIGLRGRRQHDARRTFISLCRSDGARKDLLRLITHGRKMEDVMESYSELEWKRLCRQVQRLKLGPEAAGPVEPKSARSHDSGLPPGCHQEIPQLATGSYVATPAGFENSYIARLTPPPADPEQQTAKIRGVRAAPQRAPAAPGHQAPPVATLATLALRQALAALDRGRVDEAEAILKRALAAERGAVSSAPAPARRAR